LEALHKTTPKGEIQKLKQKAGKTSLLDAEAFRLWAVRNRMPRLSSAEPSIKKGSS
jgi:hypothetical protein